jgi:hypothetical protein
LPPVEGAEPVLADKGSEPVLADKGSEPVLADKGSEPVLADKGSEPVLADKGAMAAAPMEAIKSPGLATKKPRAAQHTRVKKGILSLLTLKRSILWPDSEGDVHGCRPLCMSIEESLACFALDWQTFPSEPCRLRFQSSFR